MKEPGGGYAEPLAHAAHQLPHFVPNSQQADRLLGSEVSDQDGNTKSRKGTVLVFNGPALLIQSYEDEADEIVAVADWLKALIAEGYAPQ